jgi:uncharacterized membrane protein YgcG
MPAALVRKTVLDVFTYFFQEVPTVVIIENLHYSDHESLKCLLAMKDLISKTAIMFTMINADQYVEKQNNWKKSHTQTALKLFPVESLMNVVEDELETFRKSIMSLLNTSYIKMDDLNISEVDAMLRMALKDDSIPLGLASWIHQISSGSIFWINEMIDFLKTTSPEEFMKILDGIEASNNNGGHMASQQSILNNTLTMNSPSSPSRPMSATPNRGGGDKEQNSINRRMSVPTPISPSSSGLPLQRKISKLQSPLTRSFSVSRNHVLSSRITGAGTAVGGNAGGGGGGGGGGSGEEKGPQKPSENGTIEEEPNKEGGTDRSKLDLFIIVRFEKLQADYQRILKTAAVIGFAFSRHVLFGILPLSLKPSIHLAMKDLVKEHWIIRNDASDFQFSFTHPFILETLYTLTPLSDRKFIHKAVAEYYEAVNPDDPRLYGEMSRHFVYCNELKALEYAIRTVDYNLTQYDFDIEFNINILFDCVPLCKSMIDVETILRIVQRTRFMLQYNDDDLDDDGVSGTVNGGGAIGLDDSLPHEGGLAAFSMSEKQPGGGGNNGNNGNNGSYGELTVSPRPKSKNTPRSAGQQPSSFTKRFISISVTSCFSCFPTSSTYRKYNTILPVSRDEFDAMSHYSSMSRGGQQFTDEGKQVILLSLNQLERLLRNQLEEFRKSGKKGTILPWHRRIIHDVDSSGRYNEDPTQTINRYAQNFFSRFSKKHKT